MCDFDECTKLMVMEDSSWLPYKGEGGHPRDGFISFSWDLWSENQYKSIQRVAILPLIDMPR